MNKAFRLVWDEQCQQLVIVAENSRSRSKKSGGRKTLVAAAALGALALPLLAPGAGWANNCVMQNYNNTNTSAPGSSAGVNQIVCGNSASTRGTDSIAIGFSTHANGSGATAVGAYAEARKISETDSSGYEAASGASAFGYLAKAQNDQATAIGHSALATGLNSLASGFQSKATKEAATALGTKAQATGNKAIAVGYDAIANKDQSTAIGTSARATGNNSIAVGTDARSSMKDATAVGTSSRATGENTAAYGLNAQAVSENATALGTNALAQGTGSVSIGSSNYKYSTKYSRINQTEARGQGSVAIGENARAIGDVTSQATEHLGQSIAIGSTTLSNAQQAVAIGAEVEAHGPSSVAIGGDDVGYSGLGDGNTLKKGYTAVKKLQEGAGGLGEIATALNMDENSYVSPIAQNITTNRDASLPQPVEQAYYRDTTTTTGAAGIAIGAKAKGAGDLSVAIGVASTTGSINDDGIPVDEDGVALFDAKGYRLYHDKANSTADAPKLRKLYDSNGRQLYKADDESIGDQGYYYKGDGTVSNEDQTAWETAGTTTLVQDKRHQAGAEAAMALGPTAHAEADYSSAIGVAAYSAGLRANAVGFGAAAIGEDANALGTSKAAGKQSNVFGYRSRVEAESSGAFGNKNAIEADSDKTFVVGNNVKTTTRNSVFLGDSSAYVTGDSTGGATGTVNEATVRTDSGTDVKYEGFAGKTAVGVVSVGAAGAERRIQNVAAGLVTENSTDAINGSQLYQVAKKAGEGWNIGDVSEDASGDETINVINVAPGDNVAFIDGNGTNVVIDSKTYQDANGDDVTANTVKYDVNPGDGIKIEDNKVAVDKDTTTPTASDTGSINLPSNDNKYWDSKQVATAINAAHWNVEGATDGGTNKTGSTLANKPVTPGTTVKLQAGEGIDIKQDGTNFTFSGMTATSSDGKKLDSVTTAGGDTYTVAAGDENWTMTVDGGNATGPGETRNLADSDTINVTYDDKTGNVTFNANTGSVTVNNGAPVTNQTDGNKLVTVNEVAQTINNTYWTAKGPNDTAEGAGYQVKPGGAVSFKPAKNGGVVVTRNGSDFTFAVDKDTTTPAAGSTGSINKPKTANKYWDSQQVTTAINAAHWNAIGGQGVDDKYKANIKAGNDVTIAEARTENNGVKIKQVKDANGTTFQFSGVDIKTNDDGNVTHIYDADGGEHGIQGDSWTMTVDGGNPTAAGDKRNLADSDTINVTYDDKTGNVTFNANTGDVTVNNGAPVTNQTDSDKLVTVQNVADAINNAHWNVKAAADGGTTSGTVQSEAVKAGNTLQLIAGKGVNVNQNGRDFTFSVNKNENAPSNTGGNVGGTVYKPGQINAGDKAGDTYWDSTQVASAVNSAYWQAVGGENVAGKSAENITAGKKVTINTANHRAVSITQTVDDDGTTFTFNGFRANGSLQTDPNDSSKQRLVVNNFTDGNGDTYYLPDTTFPASDTTWEIFGDDDKTSIASIGNENKVQFQSGKGTKATVKPGDDPITAVVSYDVNAGDGLTINDGGKLVVNHGDTLINNTDGSIDVNTGDIVYPGDPGYDTSKKGKTSPKKGDEKKIATVQNVSDAINAAHWNVIGAGNGTGFKETGVAPGETVTIEAGDGLYLTQDGRKLTLQGPTFTGDTDNNAETVTWIDKDGKTQTLNFNKGGGDGMDGFNVQATGNQTDDSKSEEKKIGDGETVKIAGGTNIKLKQDGATITVNTADDVTFNSVTTKNLTATGDTNLSGPTTISGDTTLSGPTTITGDTTYEGDMTGPNNIVTNSFVDASKTEVKAGDHVLVTEEDVTDDATGATKKKYTVNAAGITGDDYITVEGGKVGDDGKLQDFTLKFDDSKLGDKNWNMTVNGGDTTTPGGIRNLTNKRADGTESPITMSMNGNDVVFDVATGGVTFNTDKEGDNYGAAATDQGDAGSKLTTVNDVATAINNAHWNVTGGGNGTGFEKSAVKAGDTVTVKAGDGLYLTQSGQTLELKGATAKGTEKDGVNYLTTLTTVNEDGSTTTYTVNSEGGGALSFKGEDGKGEAFDRIAGQTTNVVGGNTVDGDDSTKNITVSSDGKDTLTVTLNKDVDLGDEGSLTTNSLTATGDTNLSGPTTISGDTTLSGPTTITGDTTYTGDMTGGDNIVTNSFVEGSKTEITGGKNVTVTDKPVKDDATGAEKHVYTIDADNYDTIVQGGSGVTVTGGDLDPNTQQRTYTVSSNLTAGSDNVSITDGTDGSKVISVAGNEVEAGSNVGVSSRTGDKGQTIYTVNAAGIDGDDAGYITVTQPTFNADGTVNENFKLNFDADKFNNNIYNDGDGTTYETTADGKVVFNVNNTTIGVEDDPDNPGKKIVNVGDGGKTYATAENVAKAINESAQMYVGDVPDVDPNTGKSIAAAPGVQGTLPVLGWSAEKSLAPSAWESAAAARGGLTPNSAGQSTYSSRNVQTRNDGKQMAIQMSNNPTFGGTAEAPNVKIMGDDSQIVVGNTANGGNPITVDGSTGMIGGLTNKTYDPNTTYTGGYAATQEQLQQAVGGMNMSFSGDRNVHVNRDGNHVSISLDPNVHVNSVTVNDGVRVVGGPSMTRNGIDAAGKRITNVAPGVDDTDAVNVSQLRSLDAKYNKMGDRADAGIAGAMAAAAVPQVTKPGANLLGAGAGYFHDQSAVAVGYSAMSDNGKWILRGNVSVSTEEAAASAGVGYQW